MTDNYLSVGAPTQDWELVVDALWALHHRCVKFGAPILADRYRRMAERLEDAMFGVTEPG